MGMSTAVRKSLRHRLLARDGNICHYCDCEMVSPPAGGKAPDRAMTLEHIVPQSYGGTDDITNLVLACAECNNARGNDLDFCWCDHCKRVMQKWTDRKFFAIINANKARVKFSKGAWRVRLNKQTYTFIKWEDAIHYATTGEKQNA